MENRLAEDLDHILDHTRDLWDELRGQRLFITGGTGFFGCWLLESFIWANDRLNLDCHATVVTRSPEAFKTKAHHLAEYKAVSLIEGDIQSFRYPSGTFSHIIHAAAETNTKFSPVEPGELFLANIKGTKRMLEFADKCDARKFLFTSSGAVYGNQQPGISHIPEDYSGAPDTIDPSTAYGQSKRASEFLCATLASAELETKIARCFAFVGPFLPLDAEYAIGNFIRDGLLGKSIQVKGDGTPYRSYLYAADLAIWLWTILFRGRSSRPYNVGSGDYLSIFELAQMVKELVAPEVRVMVVGKPIAGKSPERYVPSIERCTTELGLQVRIPLSEAIRRTANWYIPLISNDLKGA